MSYRIAPGEPPGPAVRRVAAEQADRALGELADDALAVGERVHQLRKRLKKIRGALRLVRDGFDDYAAANRRLRDLGRGLAPHRDARVLFMLARRVGEAAPDAAPPDGTAPLLRALRAPCTIAEDEAPARLESVRAELTDIRRWIESWRLAGIDGDIVLAGLERTHRRLRKCASRARRRNDTATFHAWRKRCKYHYCHLRLVAPVASGRLADRVDRFDGLADLLGDAHDRSVLLGWIERSPAYVRDAPATRLVAAACVAQRRTLRRDALAVARGLAEEPDTLMAELLGCPWRLAGDAPARLVS